MHHLMTESLRTRWYALIAASLLLGGCGGGNSDAAQGGSLANPPPVTSGSWELVWEDAFDGDALDTGSWDVQTGNGAEEGIPGWGNNELQYYQEDNVTVSDGLLTIEARAEAPNPGFNYTSGRIRTQGKVDFTFGRVEARIKVPSGQGLWSAFWLLGSDPAVYGDWPARGEIDILEKYLPGFFSSAVHYGSYFPQNESVSGEYSATDIADDFHVYAVEWDAEFIRFFVDGVNFYTVNSDTYYNYYYKNRNEGFVLGGASAPFDEDHHVILNLAVGGNLPGTPEDPSVFPSQMQVDYVRLYECPVDRATGKGCRDSIDPVDDYISFDVAEDAPIVTSSTLYRDGSASLFAGTNVERELKLAVFDNNGAFSAIETTDDAGETVISVTTSGGGNVSLTDVTGATFDLVNMGSVDYPLSTADFKFAINIDTSRTDPSGELQVKFDSGFPDVAVATIPMSELAADGWQQVSVPVADILRGGRGLYGGGPADISALVNLITFEPTASASFLLNDIRLDCGAKDFCGIQAVATTPFTVFDGEASEQFDRGIIGYDTDQNTNYSESQGNHVSWEVIDSGDESIGTVIETTFSAGGASGVTFIGSSSSIDLTPWSAGEVAFDVKVVSNPNNFPMVFKLDGVDPVENSTGDQSLGVLPVGEWKTIRIPLASLASSGYDLSDFAAFVLFPTFAGQDVVFQWGNIRIEPTLSVVAEQISVPIDFEAPRVSYRFNSFEGGAASIATNPELSAVNASENVAQFQKFSGATFAGTVLLLDQPVDFSQGEVFQLAVWSPRNASLTFKLEGLDIERVIPLAGEGWEIVEADFSGATGAAAVSALTFIFDNGTVGDAAGAQSDWTFYVDNIELKGAASVPGQISDVNFEGANPALGTIGGGWKVYGNVFNSDGSYAYGYGPFDAPNNTGGFSQLEVLDGSGPQGNFALSVINDYNNADAHGSGQVIESNTFLEYTIRADDSGVMVFSFDAKKPQEGGVEPPAKAVAYVQILNPTAGFSVTERVEVDVTDLSSDAWTSLALEIRVDGALLEGQLLQYGFSNTASNNAPSAMLYDNILLKLNSDGGSAPPDVATLTFFDDFEDADASASTVGNNWKMYVNVFDSDGVYVYGYGPFDAPNGTEAVSGIAFSEAGMDQGVQYLNVFSDYANADHGAGRVLETSVFKENPIKEGDSGTYRFSFDAKRPSEGGLDEPTTAEAFIKILDPNSGYSLVFSETLDMSAISTEEWGTFSLEVAIDGGDQAGQLIQFGFSNTATNYDPSGVYYDNVSVEEI